MGILKDFFLPLGASIGSSLFNNQMARYNARESMAWQERMMDKQNVYNSPLNQLLMKRAAGVNPYTETGFVPSAGVSGVQADTIPMDNPLAYAKTFAEIENINAATNKIETDTDKLLKEMAMLDLGHSRGLISNEVYQRESKLLFEEWSKRNPFTVEREYTEAETALARQRVNESKAQESYTKSLTDTANTMRPLLADAEKANTAYTKARIAHTIAETTLIPFMQKEIESRTELNVANTNLTRTNRAKIEEELIQLLDSRDFNLMLKEAGANEAKAKAAIEAAKAHVREVTLENVSGGNNFLDTITSTVDALVWHLVND